MAEVKEAEAPIEIKNSDIYLEVGSEVSEMKVELKSDTGAIREVKGITINPTKLNVNYQKLLLLFLLPLSLALLVIEVFCDKEGFGKMMSSLKNYRCLLADLVSRDIKTKYRRSVLGILWSVLNPLLMMLVLTAVFSNVFRFQIEDFPVYYLTGYILFNFVSDALSCQIPVRLNLWRGFTTNCSPISLPAFSISAAMKHSRFPIRRNTSDFSSSSPMPSGGAANGR